MELSSLLESKIPSEEESKKEKSHHSSGASLNIQHSTKLKRKRQEKSSGSGSSSQDPEYVPEDRSKTKAQKKNSSTKQTVGLVGGGRVFTDDDEIVILRGMIDYRQSMNISDPAEININDVYVFLKEKVEFSSNFTNTQMYEKVRGLKKKYLKNCEKEFNGKGEGFVFRTGHDALVFEISKKVWGTDTDYVDPVDSLAGDDEKVDDEKNEEKEDEGKEDFWNKYPFICEAFESFEGVPFTVEESVRILGSVKAKELEIKWGELNFEEKKLKIEKLKLESKLTKFRLDALKNDRLP